MARHVLLMDAIALGWLLVLGVKNIGLSTDLLRVMGIFLLIFAVMTPLFDIISEKIIRPRTDRWLKRLSRR